MEERKRKRREYNRRWISTKRSIELLIFLDFQQAVLRKLDLIIENQRDGLLMMQKVSALLNGGQDQDVEDVVPAKMKETDEVEELCERLQTPEFRKKMVCLYFLLLFYIDHAHNYVTKGKYLILSYQLW